MRIYYLTDMGSGTNRVFTAAMLEERSTIIIPLGNKRYFYANIFLFFGPSNMAAMKTLSVTFFL